MKANFEVFHRVLASACFSLNRQCSNDCEQSMCYAGSTDCTEPHSANNKALILIFAVCLLRLTLVLGL